MRPAPRLVLLLALWTLAGGLPVWWPDMLSLWLAGGGLLLAGAVLDRRELGQRSEPGLERQVYPLLPLGVWQPVRLRLHNPDRQPCRVTVFDHYPQPAELAGLPCTLTVAASSWAELDYRLRPLERGEAQFGRVQTVLGSRFALWRRTVWLGQPLAVRVYPNFATIAHYALLATSHRVTTLGIQRRRRRGEGQEFHQLREYRVGDALRQIDWNATARCRKLISREYQEERDQIVLFLLDGSRRMRARDGLLSHFDHALDALILLSYMALDQGDAVAIHSFGGNPRWLPPRKGKSALARVIQTVYDLQPTLQPPDYRAAAGQLLTRQRKRALVVLLTTLRDEDSDELGDALRLLSQRHLVLLASLRESILDTTVQQPVVTLAQARQHAAVCHYLVARDRCQQRLRTAGGLLLDVAPHDLPLAVVNRYLEIKLSRRL